MAALGTLEEVQGLLEELAALDPPLVRQLERQPGKSERRWAQLLGGEPEEGPVAETTATRAAEVYAAPWQAELQALREELRALREEQARLAEEFALFRTQFE